MRDTAAVTTRTLPCVSKSRQVLKYLALGLWLWGQHASAAPAELDTRKQAVAAIDAAVKAFGAGDHKAALAHFEKAMTLRPSPKIHYNIGICHQQLMLKARSRGDANAEAEHAAAAVEAFKSYLRGVPDAEDRIEVEATIRDLGGTPLTQFRLKPIPAPRNETPVSNDVTQTPSGDTPPVGEAPPPSADPSPSSGDYPPPPVAPTGADAPTTVQPAKLQEPAANSQEPPPKQFRGRVGVGFGLLGQPQIGASRLDGAVQGLALSRLGGFVGKRRRIYLGGTGLLAGAGQTSTEKLALNMQALFLDLEYAHPLGHARRLEFMVGGFVVGAREVLRMRADAERPSCASSANGTLVSQRGGAGAGGRVGLHVLLGQRKNHEIGVRLSTAILGFGKGTAAADCEPRPFSELDVPKTRWILFVDSGYAFRF